MNHFLEALERCITDENWYGALFIALTLPDICGKIEYPEDGSTSRYVKWSQKYLLDKHYKANIEINHHLDSRIDEIAKQIPSHFRKKVIKTTMTGRDLFALRCAYLHEGLSELTSHRIKETLRHFEFRQPPPNCIFDNNLNSGNYLQIQVSIFCKNLISSIREWLIEIEDDQVKMEKINNFAFINFSAEFIM